jgi:carbon-monoxide dehydrogenase large subunit
VRIEPTGQVNVILGTGAHGQGIETTMGQVVAEHLGVAFEDVVVLQGDTMIASYGGGTGGSRTAVTAGAAASGAAELARAKVLAVAAHLMEAAPEDLELSEGSVTVRGTPSRSVSLLEVATAAYHKHELLPPDMEPGLEATFRYKAPGRTWANACHACTVEVDQVTGKVEILRYVVSEDCGVLINPMIVEGQVSGGVVQGIGGVLYEHLVYDEDGNPLTTTFLDYLLPTAAEVPTIEFGHVETRSNTPGGHKGVGEGGAIVSPPTVFNAVADALAQIGVKVTDMPLGPNQIVAAIEAAGVTTPA